MELTLTPDVENALSTQALLQQSTPEQLALDTLREVFVVNSPEQEVAPATQPVPLLDFLKEFVGVLRSSEMKNKQTVTSENTGKAFTQILTEKRNQGQL